MLLLPLVAGAVVLLIVLSLLVPAIIVFRSETIQFKRDGLVFQVLLPAVGVLLVVFVGWLTFSAAGLLLDAIVK